MSRLSTKRRTSVMFGRRPLRRLSSQQRPLLQMGDSEREECRGTEVFGGLAGWPLCFSNQANPIPPTTGIHSGRWVSLLHSEAWIFRAQSFILGSLSSLIAHQNVHCSAVTSPSTNQMLLFSELCIHSAHHQHYSLRATKTFPFNFSWLSGVT